MKIKKIVDICRRERMFMLYNGRFADGTKIDNQWLGNASALYPLEGMPFVNTDSLCTMFDIDEKKRNKISFVHEANLPDFLDFRDVCEGECYAARLEPWVTIGGYGTLIPYETSTGVAFVAQTLLEPFEDIRDEVELYERRTASGSLYFAAKNGMLLVGLIMPVNIICEAFVSRMRTLSGMCETALARKGAGLNEQNIIEMMEGNEDERH